MSSPSTPPLADTAPAHPATPSDTAVRPWTLQVPQADLDDLAGRLDRVRWPSAAPSDPEPAPAAAAAAAAAVGSQGPPLPFMQRLVTHWRESYDWRRCEADLNALGQHRTTIDGVDLYFLHVLPADDTGPGSPASRSALPLLLCHGWPSSVLDFRGLVPALTDPTSHGGRPQDAFELVIPAMPGFAFSGRPTSPGWGVQRIAAAYVELMDRLGHHRFGLHGGDWGSPVVEAISRLVPERVIGLHTNLPLVFPTPAEVEGADEDERAMIADAGAYQARGSGYAAHMSTRPQTVGYALDDSPVALAAWVSSIFFDAADHDGDPSTAVSKDALLDDVMLYWLPRAGASSARLYFEAAQERPRFPSAEDPNPVPTGISVFPREAVRTSRRWALSRYPHLVHHRQHERGGHFAALEQSAALVEDLRATFAGLRP